MGAAVIKQGSTARTQVEKKDIPVKVWGSIGAVILAFQIYVAWQWITGPFFTPVLPGPSPIPLWLLVSARIQEFLMTASFVYALWRFVYKPWRRDGHMNSDGLVCLGLYVFAWFLDPVTNYGGPAITYNAYLINMGSWMPYVPGGLLQGTPGHQVPEPLLWTGGIYGGVIFLISVLGAWMMRKAKERIPGLTPVGVYLVIFPVVFLIDILLEAFVLMPMGTYTYLGAPGLCINCDTFYKFPIYEALSWGLVWMAWSTLLYYRDDRGLTFVERGAEDLKIPRVQKTFLRFLAVGAYLSITMILFAVIPWYWMETNMSPYPEDALKRSYYLDGICGEGTTFMCPGPAVPNWGGNKSARITPEGKLYVPEGVELPKMVLHDKTPNSAEAQKWVDMLTTSKQNTVVTQ